MLFGQHGQRQIVNYLMYRYATMHISIYEQSPRSAEHNKYMQCTQELFDVMKFAVGAIYIRNFYDPVRVRSNEFRPTRVPCVK